jgi:hypothetical protein
MTMNKIRIVAGFAVTAAAITGLTSPAHAKLAPMPTSACAKWVADNNVSGRNGVSIRDNVGATHVIKKGYPQWFCPVSAYVHSGYDLYAHAGSASSTLTSTGWHAMKSSLVVTGNTLYVWEY